MPPRVYLQKACAVFLSVRYLRIHIVFAFTLLITACHSTRDIAKTSTENASRAKYAALIGIPEKDLSNKKLVKFLDGWYGIPYKYGGADKSGIDCSHLTCRILQDVYGKQVSGTAVDLEKMCEHVKESKLKEGDLIFFKIESKNISHVGVYIANHHFMHASSKKGVMISDLDEPYFKKYFYNSGRIN